MASKCANCGKYASNSDVTKCIKCTKCNLLYHRTCANVAEDMRLTAKWLCQGCKGKATVGSGRSATPQSGGSCSPGTEQDDAFGESDPQASGEVALATEIRLLRKELASVSREMASFRQEMVKLNSTVNEFGKRLDSVETRVFIS